MENSRIVPGKVGEAVPAMGEGRCPYLVARLWND